MRIRSLTRCMFVWAAGSVLACSTRRSVAQVVTNVIQGPFIGSRVTPFIQTNDVRVFPKTVPWKPGDPVRVIEDLEAGVPIPLAIEGPKVKKATVTLRGPLSGARAAAPGVGSGLIANFDGVPSSGALPPDATGDVGPNHYIQAVNSDFSIYDKQGNLLAGPTLITSLWTGFGGPCETETTFVSDPLVQYDHLADRWLISQIVYPGGAAGFHECIAVSRTADPVSGGWYLYDFVTPDFPDYPKVTVWPDAYYMCTQRCFIGGGLDVYAFDRANMLIGATATYVQFFVPATYSIILLPSDLDGPAPPAGTPNFFVRPVDGDLFGGADRIEIFAC